MTAADLARWDAAMADDWAVGGDNPEAVALIRALIAEVRTLRAEAGQAEAGVLVGQVRIARSGNWWRDAEGVRHECRALEAELLAALETPA